MTSDPDSGTIQGGVEIVDAPPLMCKCFGKEIYNQKNAVLMPPGTLFQLMGHWYANARSPYDLVFAVPIVNMFESDDDLSCLAGGPKKFLYAGPKKGIDDDSDDFPWNFTSARGQKPQTGEAKKFIYAQPKKGSDDDSDDFSWNFNSARGPEPKTCNLNTSKFDLDGVWSIRGNVNIGGPLKPPKADLSFNTNKSYYSRYTDGKDKDELSALHEIAPTNIDNTDSTGIKIRNTEGQSRRHFSYASGSDAQIPSNVLSSPSQISTTSKAYIPQTSDNQFLSLNNRNITSETKFNNFRGKNLNNQTDEKTSLGMSVQNKIAFPSSNVSTSHSVQQAQQNNMLISNSDKGNTRNSLFTKNNNSTSWNNRSSLDGGSSSNRHNQPFW